MDGGDTFGTPQRVPRGKRRAKEWVLPEQKQMPKVVTGLTSSYVPVSHSQVRVTTCQCLQKYTTLWYKNDPKMRRHPITQAAKTYHREGPSQIVFKIPMIGKSGIKRASWATLSTCLAFFFFSSRASASFLVRSASTGGRRARQRRKDMLRKSHNLHIIIHFSSPLYPRQIFVPRTGPRKLWHFCWNTISVWRAVTNRSEG